jgi:hypothetical protein
VAHSRFIVAHEMEMTTNVSLIEKCAKNRSSINPALLRDAGDPV